MIPTVHFMQTDYGQVRLTYETIALMKKLDPMFDSRRVPPRKGSKARAAWDLLEHAAHKLARDAYFQHQDMPTL